MRTTVNHVSCVRCHIGLLLLHRKASLPQRSSGQYVESWNIVIENVTAISGLSTLPVALGVCTSGLALMASTEVLCVFLCLCTGNGSGRVAPARQAHNREVRAQQGTVRRDVGKRLSPRIHRRKKRQHRTRTNQPARQKKSPQCAYACPGSKGSVSPLSGHDAELRKDDTYLSALRWSSRNENQVFQVT